MKDLNQTFDELKALMSSHESKLDVVANKPGNYYVNTQKHDEKNKPIFFGMVKTSKDKVAFHLMPVYCHPELLEDISEDLRKRMQGKSCFNFTASDPTLFKELSKLTKAGVAAYKKDGKM